MILLLQYIARHPDVSQEAAVSFYSLDKTNVARTTKNENIFQHTTLGSVGKQTAGRFYDYRGR